MEGRIYFHNFLAGMRKGKGVNLERLSSGLCSAEMLSRIEAGERMPDKLMRDRLMERLGFENDGFEDYLQPEEYEVWQTQEKLLRAVEAKETAEAERLLGLLEQADRKENAVLSQFCLAMRAQLMQYQGASEKELREAFREALSLTVPDIPAGKWEGRLLAVQEWNLLMEYIHYGADAGSVAAKGFAGTYTAQAVEALLTAMQSSGMDDYSYAKIFPKAVYYLCLERMKSPLDSAACRRLLRICAEAVENLRSCMRMYWLCELLEAMVRILEIYVGLLKADFREPAPASFGQAWNRLMGETVKTQPAADRAEGEAEEPGAPEQTDDLESLSVLATQIREWRGTLTGIYREYGIAEYMENFCYLYSQTKNYRIGDVVRKRRRMLGMSAQELCGGICSEKSLRRLENNKVKTQRAIWGEMFTKLGLSPEYHRESIVTERYEAINIYRSAKGAMNNYDMEKCHHLLQRLEELVNTDILANRQELKSMDSICRLNKGEITADECMIGLQEALLQNVESVTLIGVEGTGDGELPKRGVEGGAIAEPCAHENNNSGQAWISIHVSPLSESTCKLLNRLGTERYARWCGRGTNHPPIRLKNHMSSFYQGWRRETRDRVVKKEPKKSCQILTTLSLARLLYAVI
ncbi:hypothetical protein [uncultured Acetatifactor sp.]|uniref:hypothetical protein n=1 Tax=uncultured Acetatifactor sp. TaxID=1671927 RepID=UPI00263626D9|nr:hypothetical protein [uncultured Acetatifactor sp.]